MASANAFVQSLESRRLLSAKSLAPLLGQAGLSTVVGDALYYTTTTPGDFQTSPRLTGFARLNLKTHENERITFPGSGWGDVSSMHAIGDSLYVVANQRLETALLTVNASSTALQRLTPSQSGFGVKDELAAFGDQIYFAARTRTGGEEIWRTDGSFSGTGQFIDLKPGTASSSPRRLTVVKDTLFFSAEHADRGHQLWRTDGTVAGTRVLKDLGLGYGESGSLPSNFTRVGNRLFFSALEEGRLHSSIYVTDGTARGTRRIGGDYQKPISEFQLIPVSDKLLFVADREGHGTELFLTNKAGDAAIPLPEVHPATGGGFARVEYIVSGANVFLSVGLEFEETPALQVVKINADTPSITTIATGVAGKIDVIGDQVFVTNYATINSYSADGNGAPRHVGKVDSNVMSTIPWRGTLLIVSDDRVLYDHPNSGGVAVTVYRDNDRNMQRNVSPYDSEATLQGVQVFADLNRDGFRQPHEPTATTTRSGAAYLGGLPVGKRVLIQSIRKDFSWLLTAGAQQIKVFSDTTGTTALGQVEMFSRITGTTFQDANGNTLFDAGELPTPGEQVFLDLDDDGTVDWNETVAVTDAIGQYEFALLKPGTYSVIFLGSPYAVPTTAANGRVTVGYDQRRKINFGVEPAPKTSQIRGEMYYDNNDNGYYDPGGADNVPTFHDVFLDVNGNGKYDKYTDLIARLDNAGRFEFRNLRAGRYVLFDDADAGAGPGNQSRVIHVDPGRGYTRNFVY